MVERLLLDRVETEARGASVARQCQRAIAHFTHEAEAALALVHPAMAGAQITLHPAIRKGRKELPPHREGRDQGPGLVVIEHEKS
jgi:hypothetical protein